MICKHILKLILAIGKKKELNIAVNKTIPKPPKFIHNK